MERSGASSARVPDLRFSGNHEASAEFRVSTGERQSIQFGSGSPFGGELSGEGTCFAVHQGRERPESNSVVGDGVPDDTEESKIQTIDHSRSGSSFAPNAFDIWKFPKAAVHARSRSLADEHFLVMTENVGGETPL